MWLIDKISVITKELSKPIWIDKKSKILNKVKLGNLFHTPWPVKTLSIPMLVTLKIESKIVL